MLLMWRQEDQINRSVTKFRSCYIFSGFLGQLQETRRAYFEKIWQ